MPTQSRGHPSDVDTIIFGRRLVPIRQGFLCLYMNTEGGHIYIVHIKVLRAPFSPSDDL